jgi:hypothetical protein
MVVLGQSSNHWVDKYLKIEEVQAFRNLCQRMTSRSRTPSQSVISPLSVTKHAVLYIFRHLVPGSPDHFLQLFGPPLLVFASIRIHSFEIY